MSSRGWILFFAMSIIWGIPYLMIKIAVEGVSVADTGLQGAIAHIRGPEGTTVTVSLARGKDVVAIPIVRKKLRA